MGFQRMNGIEPIFSIDSRVIDALEDPVQPKPAHLHDGLYAEADLSHQILTVYSDGEIVRIMPISSGSGKVFTEVGESPHVTKTPTGKFIFFAHIWGLHESHLGDLFNPVHLTKAVTPSRETAKCRLIPSATDACVLSSRIQSGSLKKFLSTLRS